MLGDGKKIRKGRPILFVVAILFILTAGFVVAGSSSVGSRFGWAKEEDALLQSGFVIAEPGVYDSVDTAVVKVLDSSNNSAMLMNLETGKGYSLSYDGTTSIADKHGNVMAMSQIREGDVVDVKFLKSKKKLVSIQLSEGAWVFDQLQRYSFDEDAQSAQIGDLVYSFDDSTVIVSEGKQVTTQDIIRGDVVTVSGIDHRIHSVVVERGHGYLRLSSDEYLVGGWIEVGQEVIQQITEDMLLPVPEGTYDVLLKAKGIEEKKRVTITRNQEVIIDVSDIEIQQPQIGKIIFAVMPPETAIYIDGQEKDISKPVELEYGVHQMIAKADGYDTISQYVKVGQELASLSISLEESEEDGKDNGSNSVSGNELSSSYRVYVDSPSDAEVYLDSAYQGISPVNFKKEAGTHIITFRRAGYVTKSYTIQLDDEPKDVTFSFSDLVKEQGTPTLPPVSSNKPPASSNTAGGNTTSGNTTSGNTTSGN